MASSSSDWFATILLREAFSASSSLSLRMSSVCIPRELALQDIEGVLANAVPAAPCRMACLARLRLLEDADDLVVAELRFLHLSLSLRTALLSQVRQIRVSSPIT